jgi:YVTN family beta-propeller protein
VKRNLLLPFGLAALAAAGGGYHVIRKIPVPGNGGWDYLTIDNANRRLYVSHGTQVEVLDLDSGSIAGKIPDTKGVHGIAIAPEAGRGFTSNGTANNVTIFDLKTLAVIGQVETGKKPDAIMYDPATKRIFAQNGGSDSSTAIDAATGKVAGTVELGGAPEFAVPDGKGHVFVNLEDKHEMLKLDSRNLKVMERWPLAPCEAPTALAIDLKSNRLFAGCRNQKMVVLNAATGKVIANMPIGARVDAAVFDAPANLIFFSNGDGTINVFHEDSPDKYSAVETVKTMPGAKTMALDPKTHKLYLSTAEYEPAATGQKGRAVKPGTFMVLEVGK